MVERAGEVAGRRGAPNARVALAWDRESGEPAGCILLRNRQAGTKILALAVSRNQGVALSSRLTVILLVVIFSTFPFAVGVAQEVSAGITGAITDPSGAAIAERKSRRGMWIEAPSGYRDERGRHLCVPRIPPGNYEISGSRPRASAPRCSATSCWK